MQLTVAKIKMELSVVSHNVFNKITIPNQNKYLQLEYLLKLCDLSASPILCDFWFGSNDQLKETHSVHKMRFLKSITSLMSL